MYLIAHEADKILQYGYHHMDVGSKVTLNFEEFKKESNFKYTINEFVRSFRYLDLECIIDYPQKSYEPEQTCFEFIIPRLFYVHIENMILGKEC